MGFLYISWNGSSVNVSQFLQFSSSFVVLFIITGGFVGIVFLTFIIFFIFIKCCNKETGELIEEEKDYSNIGGIVSGKSEDVSGISDEG